MEVPLGFKGLTVNYLKSSNDDHFVSVFMQCSSVLLYKIESEYVITLNHSNITMKSVFKVFNYSVIICNRNILYIKRQHNTYYGKLLKWA